jgi:hypothetical protein
MLCVKRPRSVSAYTSVMSPLTSNAEWAQKYPQERASVKINFVDIYSVCKLKLLLHSEKPFLDTIATR